MPGLADAFKVVGAIALDKSGVVDALAESKKMAEETTSEIEGGFKKAGESGKESAVGIQKAWDGLGTFMKGTIIGVVGAVATAFVGLAKTGLENTQQIQDAMQRFRVETGASEEEAQNFSNTIQALHKQNTDSYEDLANAVIAVRQRFGDLGDEMKDQTQIFLDYAKVTGQDTAQAIEKTSEILRVYNLELSDVPELLDKIMKAHQETGASVEFIQTGLQQSASMFEQYGFSLDESIALLATFDQAGLKASDTQRALRNVLERTTGASDDQAIALERLGVQVGDVDGIVQAIGGPRGALEQIISKMQQGTLSTEEMDAVMKIVGVNSGPRLASALRDGGAAVDELTTKLQDSTGAVSEASATYDKQLGERWTLIRRRYLEPFMEVIGQRLLDTLNYLLDKLENEWGPKIQKFWQDWGEPITTVVITVGQILIDTVNNAFAVIENAIKVFKGVATGDFDLIKEGLLGIWNALWGQVQSTFTNVIEAIDQLTGGWASRIVDSVTTGIDNVVDYITSIPQRFKDGARQLINAFLEGLIDAVEEIPLVGGKIAGALADYIVGESPPRKGPLSNVDEGGANIVRAWLEGIEGESSNVKSIGDKIAGILSSRFALMSSVVEGFGKVVMEAFGRNFDMAADQLESRAANAWNYLVEKGRISLQQQEQYLIAAIAAIEAEGGKFTDEWIKMMAQLESVQEQLAHETTEKYKNAMALRYGAMQAQHEAEREAERETTKQAQENMQIRYQAMQEYFDNLQREQEENTKRSRDAYTARLNAAVEYYDKLEANRQANLERARQADAARLAGLAEYYAEVAKKEQEDVERGRQAWAARYQTQAETVYAGYVYQNEVLGQMLAAVESATNKMGNFWVSLADTLQSSFSDALAGLLSGTKDFSEATQDIWNSIKSLVISAVAQMGASYITQFIAQAIAGNSSWIASTLSSLAAAVTAFLQSAYAALVGFFWYLGPFAPAAAAGVIAAALLGISAIVGQAKGLLPEFEKGGIVPGARGEPQLIVAHGGELVIPADEVGPRVSFALEDALGTGAQIVNQNSYNIYGLQPADVERAIIRGQRRLVEEWGW